MKTIQTAMAWLALCCATHAFGQTPAAYSMPDGRGTLLLGVGGSDGGRWITPAEGKVLDGKMAVRSVQLVNDIKNQLGNTTKTEADLPEMPVIPDESIEGEGNNADKNCFTYELSDGRYTVTGLTEEGRARTQLTIPYQVNGIYIDSFTAEVFAGNTVVQSVTIQNNISLLPDGAFSGCSSLREIRLEHTAPADISVGYGLFSGTSGALDVYVPEDALSAFANNYFWGRYADRLKAY